MKIGEFFVEVGGKGFDKLGESFAGANKGLKDMSSNSLDTEAKFDKLFGINVGPLATALAGLGLSIEEISRRGAKAGLTLEQFHKYTTLDVKPVQEIAHALG